jgi:hypothetical protein
MTYAANIVDANQWVRSLAEDGATPPGIYEAVLNLCRERMTFIVWDGPDSLKVRRRHFPAYKAKRPKMSSDISGIVSFAKQIFQLAPVTQIEMPGFEADDVIAHLCQKFEPMHVRIRSTDRDLEAIPNGFTDKHDSPLCEKAHVRLYKTLVGDSSDGIPGVKDFGPKSWEKLREVDKCELETFLDDGKSPNAIAGLINKAGSSVARKWLMGTDAIDQVLTFWKIVGFFSINEKSMQDHITYGVSNPSAAREIMAQYFHLEC